LTELALALPLMPVTMSEIPGPETASKRKLITAGERLLGLKGFGGVALQEIASTAGQANKYAVQYHFGDLDGLIRAIFSIRLRWIHERRAMLLDRARSLGLIDDVDALLEALFVPLAEQIDADGHHSYARFWLQYTARPGYDASNDSLFSIKDTPAEQLFVHLADALRIAGSLAHDRFGVQFSVLIYALIDRDNRRNRGEGPALDLVLVRAIRSVAAALKADLPRFPSDSR
jgi:AcrR family transcriptional regulator